MNKKTYIRFIIAVCGFMLGVLLVAIIATNNSDKAIEQTDKFLTEYETSKKQNNTLIETTSDSTEESQTTTDQPSEYLDESNNTTDWSTVPIEEVTEEELHEPESVDNTYSGDFISIDDDNSGTYTVAETEEVIAEEFNPPEETITWVEPETWAQDDTSNWAGVDPYDFKNMGVMYWNDWRWTYYSERILPGGGLQIPGRWSDGTFVRDQWGNLCIASVDLPKGTYVDTPFGPGIIYDSGCPSGTLDIYVSW